ncbi:MAG: hypothetical protein ACREBU_20355, partial [Nitrososphaera sp.]
MKQYEAVIEVMRMNGGYATLGFLYREALKVPRVIWNTKTPFASIRRIVQDERFFFKIRPGLWALKDYKDKLPFPVEVGSKASQQAASQFSHSYFQGLLVEIGNLKGFETFVPNQDKNKKFLGKSLAEVATLHHCYSFGYDRFVQRAKMVDVIWFNDRRMPSNFLEVEHSTDIQDSLLKFFELQDFYAEFRMVAPQSRQREFLSKVAHNAFHPIAGRVKFWSYELVSELHAKT